MAVPLLNHEVHGSDRDLALLLVHPLGGDIRFWDDFRAELGTRHTVVVCDLRAAGRSPRPAAPLLLAEHVRDLETLRAGLGIARLVPVGTAIGAMQAAAYAAAHPERTAALVLTNPFLKTSPEAGTMLAKRAKDVRRGGMAAILPAAIDRAFLEQPRDDRFRRYYDRFATQDAEAYALSCLAVQDADIEADLRGLRCPTLIVAGGHDALLPPAVAESVAALVPGSRYKLVSEGAHFLPYQRPAKVAALVRGFLADSGLGRS